MRRKETQKISDVLNELVKKSSFEKKLLDTRIVANWEKVLGNGIAASTSQLFVRNKTLVVRIESPVIRHELFMMRSKIIDALNASVGQEVINNIHFS
jgi:predicted nucleic acid-binding Zn ribbon protein